MKIKLIATRVPEWDMVGDDNYGNAPYGVVLDVYSEDGIEFLESGTDWSYFKTEEDAENYVKKYNKL
jgi:hypothetical protein